MAAAELGVDPADCVVIGDIGSDVAAAYAAGARAILVPAPATRPGETAGVPTAAGLTEAIAALLDGRPLPSWTTEMTPRRPAPARSAASHLSQLQTVID